MTTPIERRRVPSSKRPTLRSQTVRVLTARGRKNSSQRWLQRQLNDPYVHQAKALGYRSRAAFKLEQIDEKYHIFKSGQAVVDLGMAPGGWTQVVLARVKPTRTKQAHVIGIDLLEVDPLPGATIVQGDFLDEAVVTTFRQMCQEGADVVLSDMAASTTGHATTDHLRTIALAHAAFTFAINVLKSGGVFVAKVFQGGADHTLLQDLKAHFDEVKHFKPPASRKESPEMYVIAKGFKKSEE